MVGALLMRGMLVGLVAGLLAFGFARVFGEPPIDKAIAFEAQMEAGGGHHQHGDADQAGGGHDELELVSRGTQAGLGLFTAVVAYGAALGGLFALVFSYAIGRLGSLEARGTAGLIALAGFIAVVIVPDIKYPASPPAVGDGDTIGLRTGLFFIMLLVSVVATVLAVRLGSRLRARYGAWNGPLAAALALLVVLTVVMHVLPPIDEVPDQFSATVLWRFRLASLGMHAVLWTVIGLGFGAVAEQYLGRQAGARPGGRPLLT